MNIKNIIITFFLCVTIGFSQNPIIPTFPGANVTDIDLLVAGNKAQSRLTSTINNSTLAIPVLNASSFRNGSTITINDEIMKICSKTGNTLNVCVGGRGFDGTIAASHASNSLVSGTITAAYVNTTNANLRAVANYLRNNVKTPEMFGAVGDSVANDTVALQAAIDGLSAFDVLDGRGKTYRTGPLTLKSNITLQNFNFVKIASASNGTSLLTLDGRTQAPFNQTAKTNVGLVNITINGSRATETNITVPSTEDGSRHGIRIVGSVSNIRIRNVRVENAAGDGLLIGGWHDTNSDNEDFLPIQDVVVENSTFSRNRRNGITIEGASRVKIVNTTIMQNGTTLSGETVTTNGNHCAVEGVNCFGTGIWFENDNNALGGSLANIHIDNSYISENWGRSIYFYSNSFPTLANFVPKNKITVSNSFLDSGTVTFSGNDIAFQMNYPNTEDGDGVFYENVQLLNNTIKGIILLRGVNKFLLSGGTVEPQLAGLGFYEYADNLKISSDTHRGTLTFSSTGNLKPDGTPSTVISYGSTGGGSLAIGETVTGANTQSVLFVNNSGNLAQNNDLLFDPSTSRLAVGVSSPQNRLHIRNNATPFRMDFTGIVNSDAPSIVDVFGSSSATPTVYSRLGGIFGNFLADSKSNFGLFSDGVDLNLETLANNNIIFRTNNTNRIRISSSGLEQWNGSSWVSINGVNIQDEGSNVPVQPIINFIGTGVIVTDDPANNRTNINIASGSSGNISSLTDFSLTRTSNTVLTINSSASASNPVIMSCGNVSTQITSPGTITLSSGTANVVGFIYVNCGSGSPVLTFGHNSANTYVGSADITIATGITGFPTGVVVRPLWLANGTSGVWDVITASNDRRSAYNTMKQITAGSNIILTETAGQVQISSSGGSSGFSFTDPSVYRSRFEYNIWGGGFTFLNSGRSFSGTCGGGADYDPNGVDTIGKTLSGAPCFAFSDFPLGSVFSGSTPRSSTLFFRSGRRSAGTGDIYWGWSSSSANVNNFIGIRYLHASTKYQCVIRDGGNDVVAVDVSGTVDFLAHSYIITTGTANQVSCQIDSGAIVSASGTIPAASQWRSLVGTIVATTPFFLIEDRMQVIR